MKKEVEQFIEEYLAWCRLDDSPGEKCDSQLHKQAKCCEYHILKAWLGEELEKKAQTFENRLPLFRQPVELTFSEVCSPRWFARIAELTDVQLPADITKYLYQG